MPSAKELIQQFIGETKYFSDNKIAKYLEENDSPIKKNTIYQYLSKMKEKQKVFDAGHGWFSTIEKKFELDKSSVSSLVEKTEQEFPELNFCVWSTEQIAGYYHHLPTKFSTFFYTKKNFLTAMTDFFRGGDYQVLNNPGPKEMEKQFFIEENPLVIRPRISEEPRSGHYAMIQKILVDLWKEKDSPVIDTREYKKIFKNLVMETRINVAKLLRYADRRACKEEIKNLLMAE